MPKMVIDIRDGIDPSRALSCIGAVVAQGRVSESAGRMHYCWHTTFIDGTHVSVNRKRRNNSADSFIVHRNNAPTQEIQED